MCLCARLELSARRTCGYRRSHHQAGMFPDFGGLFLLIANILLLPCSAQNACQRAGPSTELQRLRGLGGGGTMAALCRAGSELGARPPHARAAVPHKFPLFCPRSLLTKELPRTVGQEE